MCMHTKTERERERDKTKGNSTKQIIYISNNIAMIINQGGWIQKAVFHIFTREATIVTSCYFSCIPMPSGEQILSFKLGPFSEGKQNK